MLQTVPALQLWRTLNLGEGENWTLVSASTMPHVCRYTSFTICAQVRTRTVILCLEDRRVCLYTTHALHALKGSNLNHQFWRPVCYQLHQARVGGSERYRTSIIGSSNRCMNLHCYTSKYYSLPVKWPTGEEIFCGRRMNRTFGISVNSGALFHWVTLPKFLSKRMDLNH